MNWQQVVGNHADCSHGVLSDFSDCDLRQSILAVFAQLPSLLSSLPLVEHFQVVLRITDQGIHPGPMLLQPHPPGLRQALLEQRDVLNAVCEGRFLEIRLDPDLLSLQARGLHLWRGRGAASASEHVRIGAPGASWWVLAVPRDHRFQLPPWNTEVFELSLDEHGPVPAQLLEPLFHTRIPCTHVVHVRVKVRGTRQTCQIATMSPNTFFASSGSASSAIGASIPLGPQTLDFHAISFTQKHFPKSKSNFTFCLAMMAFVSSTHCASFAFLFSAKDCDGTTR
eukprot:CAMPEP_0115401596 /NCGR_PEP_ID=MMETSP0271-20121206/15971_1 /TAXON_ID=71861 /ORGANISM="Scrippsiella trochoidea, Strain CCMP3099" /LENGTH=281 /DNA_ID=CAMNT_0002825519 /DNA_START=41 /DNA_END=887 /DNA_ORIENTATION=-